MMTFWRPHRRKYGITITATVSFIQEAVLNTLFGIEFHCSLCHQLLSKMTDKKKKKKKNCNVAAKSENDLKLENKSVNTSFDPPITKISNIS